MREGDGFDDDWEGPDVVPPYQVSAYNTAKASENKIHDDATAKRFGFRGGLGRRRARLCLYDASAGAALGPRLAGTRHRRGAFGKPVYEGDIAEITATEDADGLALQVASMGVLCATGRAALPATAPAVGSARFSARHPTGTRRSPARR